MSETKIQADCLFCKFATKEIPCHLVDETENHMAFLTIFPNTEGFTVVIPKKHLPSDAFENTDQDLQDLIVFTKRVAGKLKRVFPGVSRVGMFFEGFGVNHLHSKLFPMHGTGSLKEWKPIESKESVFFKEYPGYLSSQEGDRVDDAILAELATRIRNQA